MVGTVSRSRHDLSPQIMALILVAVSILGGLASWINPGHGGYRVGYDNRLLGVSVAYSSQPSQDPEFVIMIKDRGGRPLKTIYSVYMWMPDGEIEGLGIYGGVGVIKINYSVVRDFSRKWHDYIVSRNNDPRMVQPGLILMGAVHENNAVYGSLRSIPVNTKEILGNRSVAIEIIEDLSLKKPLVRINGTNQSVQENLNLDIELQGLQGMDVDVMELQSSWPPNEITKSCYQYVTRDGGIAITCYYWKLEYVYGSELNVDIPVVAAYIYGPNADKVNDVVLKVTYASTSTVSIDFGISAGIGKEGTNTGDISYEVVGPSWTLSGYNVWMNFYPRLFNGIDFTPPASVGAGFLGDIASARYRLYVYTSNPPNPPTNTPLDQIADMTLMRPVILNSQMIPRLMIGGDPYTSSGVLESALKYYMESWSRSQPITSQNYVGIDVFKVMQDIATTPQLSASADIIGILCGRFGKACFLSGVSLIIGASVGSTSVSQTYMDLFLSIGLKSQYVYSGYTIWAWYLYSPGKLLYKNNYYYIGSLYVEAWIV